jgi:hypothetical protein
MKLKVADELKMILGHCMMHDGRAYLDVFFPFESKFQTFDRDTLEELNTFVLEQEWAKQMKMCASRPYFNDVMFRRQDYHQRVRDGLSDDNPLKTADYQTFMNNLKEHSNVLETA